MNQTLKKVNESDVKGGKGESNLNVLKTNTTTW